jgi:predicted phage baseplate assembly protein
MPLAPLELADLTWDDLVAQARRRIAAVTRGEWTLHAPVDPGVTMLELFAWLLEQRVYWIDQVPDETLRGLLTLLGVAPHGAGVASTVIAMDPADDGSWRVMPAGTALRVAFAPSGPVYSTDEAVAVAPVRSLRVITAGRDRRADLDEGRWVRLLRADGAADDFELRLELATPPPPGLAAPMALALGLEAPAPMTPEWWVPLARPPAALFAPDPDVAAAAAPPDAPGRVPVEYRYRPVGGGEPRPLPAVRDGTQGLRRAGVVRFGAPADWAPESDGTYAVVVRAPRTDFTTPPRLSFARANAVIARHWRRVVVALARRWLPLPGVTVELPRAYGAPVAPWLRVHLCERATPGAWQRWRPVPDLSRSGPDARVLRVDRGRARLDFGDGLTGRQPVVADGAGPLPPPVDLAAAQVRESDANLVVEYLAGGGQDGDLGAAQAWTAADAGDWSGESPVAATGGGEPEAAGEARERAAAELRRVTRAVTRRDHEELARTTPGVAVARAHAVVGAHPGHPCRVVPGATTVYLVPHAPRDEEPPPGSDPVDVPAPLPDAQTLALVQARLDAARLAAHEVFVRPPRYRDARVRFHVAADPRSPGALEASVRAALTRYLDPLVGGDDGDGWPFGEPLRPSALIRAAQAAVGAGGEVSAVAIALDGALPGAITCNDVALGPAALPRLGGVTVELAPRRGDREVRR